MSARVFNPHIMSEMRRVMRGGGHLDPSESETRSPRDNSSLERIKKCLFGPVDHDECKLYVEQEMESHWEKASKKWNFDFKAGKPVSSGEGCVYEWKVLKSNEAVPEAYALARLPYLKKHTDNNQTIKSGTEGSQSCSSSSTSFTSPTRIQSRSNTDVQSSNKQTVITGFRHAEGSAANKAYCAIPDFIHTSPLSLLSSKEGTDPLWGGHAEGTAANKAYCFIPGFIHTSPLSLCSSPEDFMRKQKTMRRISSILKSESVTSVKEEEPATKKARTFEFELKL